MLIPLEFAFLSLGGGAATITRFVGLFVFGVWIFQSIFKRNKIIIPSSLQLPIVFVLWGCLSVIWAFNKNVTVSRIQTVLQLVILALLVINMINDRKQLKGLVSALFIGCFIATFLGLAGIGLKMDSKLLTLQNQGANEYGCYVGILFFIGTILLFFETGKNWSFGFVVILLSTIPLFQVNEKECFPFYRFSLDGNCTHHSSKIKNYLFHYALRYISQLPSGSFRTKRNNYQVSRRTIDFTRYITNWRNRSLRDMGVGGKIFIDNFLVGTGWGMLQWCITSMRIQMRYFYPASHQMERIYTEI